MIKNLIIIPYRDREEHLSGFIDRSLALLEPELSPLLVLVVEQDDPVDSPRLFNRGALINAGAREYLYETQFIFTHDVDFYPSRLMIKSLYSTDIPDNFIWGIYTSQWDTLAPIIKLTPRTFSMINGFPNNFWGWGEEDKALQNRAETLEVEIRKNEIMVDTTTTLNNDKFTLRKDYHEGRVRPSDGEDRHKVEYEDFRSFTMVDKIRRINSSGLNNLSYKITKDSFISENIRHIKVDLSALECNI